MTHDDVFRVILIVGMAVLIPPAVYWRVKSQSTGERLDRWQEGVFIMIALRLCGLAAIAGLIVFVSNPPAMAWSALPLPAWLRWTGVPIGALSGLLAGVSASALASVLASTIFKFEYQFDAGVAFMGILSGILIVVIAGMLGTRSVLTHPPVETLRQGGA